MTIFDFVTSVNIVAYWEAMKNNRAPYFFESMFPNDKQLGMSLQYIKGASGLPIALNVSALDVKAVPRTRIGFDKLSAEMPFFKESLYVDEKLRQELNIVLQTGNQALIDTIMNKVFADTVQLIEAAAVSRERMRAMAVTTGAITLSSNGQEYNYDFGVPDEHKFTAKTFNTPEFDIVGYLNDCADKVEIDTGVRPTNAVVSKSQMSEMMKNDGVKKSIYVLTNGVGALTEAKLVQFLQDQTGLTFHVVSKQYRDENKVAQKYVPDNVIALYPDGKLGNTWFGTTPEESDLMTGSTAAVSITDTGVAVTTMKYADPVNVETKVSQICLPSFEMADQIAIIDTTPQQ